MSELIDYVFSGINQRHSRKLHNSSSSFYKCQNETYQQNQKQQTFLQKISTQQQEMQIYARIRHKFEYLSVSIQCFVNNKPIKAETQFQKTFLMKQLEFIAFPQSMIPKLNPNTGEITINFLIFKRHQNQYRKSENINEILYQNQNNKQLIKNFFIKITRILKWKTSTQKFGTQSLQQANLVPLTKLACNIDQTQKVTFSLLKKTNFKEQKPNRRVEFIQKLNITQKHQIKIHQCQLRKILQSVGKLNRQIQQGILAPANNFNNIQSLNINAKDLDESAFNLKFNQQNVFKVNDQKFGKLNITLLEDKSIKNARLIENLRSLDKGIDYSFLDHYFQYNIQGRVHMAKLALKKTNLVDFLQSNGHCLSFQIKLKIFFQIFSALKILEERHGYMMSRLNLKNFEITKNFSVKLKGLQNLIKIDQPFQKTNEYELYSQKIQNFARIYFIFERLFLNKKSSFTKQSPSSGKCSQLINFKLENLKNTIKTNFQYLRFYGIPQVLNPILHIFDKYLNQFQVQMSQQELSVGNPQDRFNHYNKAMIQMQKGNKNLILGVLIRSTNFASQAYRMF